MNLQSAIATYVAAPSSDLASERALLEVLCAEGCIEEGEQVRVFIHSDDGQTLNVERESGDVDIYPIED